MAKYIHNISGSTKTYQGIEIDDATFYQIQDSLLVEFQNEVNLLTDLLAGTVRMSSDGSTDYSSTAITNVNYLRNEHYEVDTEGRQIVRAAAGKKGWTYQARAKTITTSDITAMYCHDWQDNSCVCCTAKFFDVNGDEITDQQTADTDCVRTEILFKPDFDYEIVGGYLRQHTRPSQNVKIWVVAGIIELGGAYIKEMVRSEDLKFLSPDSELRTDGRAAKFMIKDIPNVPYQANQIKFILKHPAGLKHELLIGFELFLP
jgi:hypothetical protein